uniref:Uncharacterized protein n=1 Tax=Ditylenchus dipsaci TaxID=166011 RepID=A0A915DJD7_9BILA
MLIRRYSILKKRYPRNKKYAVYYFTFMNFFSHLMKMGAPITGGSETRDTVSIKVADTNFAATGSSDKNSRMVMLSSASSLSSFIGQRKCHTFACYKYTNDLNSNINRAMFPPYRFPCRLSAPKSALKKTASKIVEMANQAVHTKAIAPAVLEESQSDCWVVAVAPCSALVAVHKRTRAVPPGDQSSPAVAVFDRKYLPENIQGYGMLIGQLQQVKGALSFDFESIVGFICKPMEMPLPICCAPIDLVSQEDKPPCLDDVKLSITAIEGSVYSREVEQLLQVSLEEKLPSLDSVNLVASVIEDSVQSEVIGLRLQDSTEEELPALSDVKPAVTTIGGSVHSSVVDQSLQASYEEKWAGSGSVNIAMNTIEDPVHGLAIVEDPLRIPAIVSHQEELPVLHWVKLSVTDIQGLVLSKIGRGKQEVEVPLLGSDFTDEFQSSGSDIGAAQIPESVDASIQIDMPVYSLITSVIYVFKSKMSWPVVCTVLILLAMFVVWFYRSASGTPVILLPEFLILVPWKWPLWAIV